MSVSSQLSLTKWISVSSDSLNRKFCYPRVHGKNLDFYEVSSIDELTPGYAGILEPPTSANKITDWTTEDLILVPGRRFDWEGGRTGSGLGFYDRFLDANPAQKWGVAFENQVSKEPLAQKPTDVRMDAIVTHAGIKVLRKR